MLQVTLVFNDKKDKELLDIINTTIPFFINYIDINTVNGRKEGFKVMNYWSARKLPFIEVKKDNSEDLPKVFYSEIGESAINQFINWINNESINKKTN